MNESMNLVLGTTCFTFLLSKQSARIHPINPFQNGSAINGVTVLNGQPASLSAPYEGDVDNEKWWWVCCLEFCFCLL